MVTRGEVPFSAVYPISPEGLERQALLAWAADLAGEGCRLLQYRRKTGSDRERFADVSALLGFCRSRGVKLILDDRVDLCLVAGADGVHLGQQDLPAAEARTLLGPGAIIGLSTHNLDQFRQALQLPVDYLALGPVHPTASKDHPDPVVPVEVQEAVLKESPLPVVAIGGIHPQNARPLWERGFASLAVISCLSSDPAAGWRALLSNRP
jgi:thiamine-phosphate pyrophosphorylase